MRKRLSRAERATLLELRTAGDLVCAPDTARVTSRLAARGFVRRTGGSAVFNDAADHAYVVSTYALTPRGRGVADHLARCEAARADGRPVPGADWDASVALPAQLDLCRAMAVVFDDSRRDDPATWHTFASLDDADDWFGRWLSMPQAFEYVAYFDKSDPTYPGPVNERTGTHVHVGHWLLPMAVGLPLGYAAGKWGGQAIDWARAKFHR